ncbi:hypothetical protein [Cytophaga aurantiaca]|uniref:hypothetical protein n=1 Tax=Cytophaga aurantiaca TaxID=29530 RepID=UPI0003815916|nr:hypothetical protein [Cytophaga aurantiaca]
MNEIRWIKIFVGLLKRNPNFSINPTNPNSDNIKNMKIEITYKYKNKTSVESVDLTAEQYFDPIDEDENYEDDSIPRYDQTVDYIIEVDSTITEEDLEYSILEIQDSIESDKSIKTTYFGNESQLLYRIDYDGFELIIQSIRVAENCIVVTRMERPDTKSEWINISYSTILNYKKEHSGEETLYSAKAGEYIRKNILED